MASLDTPPAHKEGTLYSFCSSEFDLIPEEQEEIVLHYSTNSTAVQTDLISARFELSEEEQEIQRRLFELVEDNKTLRETLQQSSALMRSELNSIAAWPNNMAALNVSLQEAQARIQELEQEKEELLKKTQREDEEGQAVKNSFASVEDSEYVIIQKKSKDTESLESQLKEAKLNNAELEHKIEEQNLKIETMRNMYKEIEKEKNDLKSKLVNQEELNLRNGELLLNQAEGYQEKNYAMQEEHGRIVAKLQEQIKSLEEKLASETRAVEAGKIKNLEDKKLLRNLQSDYDRVTKTLQMQSRKEKQEIETMQNMYKEIEKKRNDLKSKLVNQEELNVRNGELLLNQAKEYEEKTNAMEEEHGRVVAKLQEQIKSLEEKLVSETRAVETAKKEKQETDSLDCKRRNKEQIDSLTARLLDCKQRLEESETRVFLARYAFSDDQKTLKNHLSTSSNHAPAVRAARQQELEERKYDLHNAIQNNKTILEEFKQLEKQFKELQQKQATAFFCSSSGAGSVHGGRGKRRTHKGSESNDRPSHPEFFICPICQFGFTELRALENHVETCINKNQ